MDHGKGVENMTDYLIPVLLFLISAIALWKKENSYNILLSGARDGLNVLLSIFPALILLLTSVKMFQTSGAAVLLSRLLSPFLSFFGIPPECALLILVRPISGSAALAVATDLMTQYGVNSTVGRTVAVMLGSTETTFYTISVYFGAAGIRKTKYTVPAALFADFIGFLAASWTVRLL